MIYYNTWINKLDHEVDLKGAHANLNMKLRKTLF